MGNRFAARSGEVSNDLRRDGGGDIHSPFPLPHSPILTVHNLKKYYPLRTGIFRRKIGDVKAVEDVSFSLMQGETLGLVGESGCGKSTLGRTLMRLEDATAGSVDFEGTDLMKCRSSRLFELRRDLQMIFQDPYSSLNPRMTVGDIVREPLDIHRIGSGEEREAEVRRLLERVGLKAEMTERYPHEFSGGQRQRIGIARALALRPKLIIADEPVSALDVSVQAQVINLMVEVQRQFNLTYIFISHDLNVVEYISDRVAIMYLGRIVEYGKKETIFANPKMPYTRALMASSPVADPRARGTFEPIKGEIPSAVNPPAGCPFHPRCPFAIEECKKVVPPLDAVGINDGDDTHVAACIRKHEI